MKMLTKLYEILLDNSAICEEHLFMNNNKACKKILLITKDNTSYDVLIVNGEVKEIIEF